MQKKIQKLLERLDEVEALLGDPDVLKDKKKYRQLTQEHSYLSDVKSISSEVNSIAKQLEDNRILLKDEEEEDFRAVLEEDIAQLDKRFQIQSVKLETLLVPPDPRDHRNTIIEIRAGTGGDEAALFAGDCVRMYKIFADNMGWQYEELSSTPSEVGGYKEFVMVLSGQNVFRFLHYEGGTHRVQRVPDTETQGRVHTSAITVAVMLEPDEESEVNIDEKEIRVDTYRASGAGGQHVNTTDSAVRITHLPTGLVAYCQQERSQHKNREKAMRLLKAKIAEEEQRKRDLQRTSERNAQVGSGDRSERIRTYNFAQNRITDHRIGFTRYNLDKAMEGELGEVTAALVTHYHHEKLHQR